MWEILIKQRHDQTSQPVEIEESINMAQQQPERTRPEYVASSLMWIEASVIRQTIVDNNFELKSHTFTMPQ